VWSGPPLADEIRAKDQQRLLDDPILTEPSSEEDLRLAARILADRSPEQVAAALIRLHRQRMPEPEDLFDDVRDTAPTRQISPRGASTYEPLREGPPGAAHRVAGETAWFRMPIGRQNNADPKWLIPLICRLGHVTKKDIGQIRIFDRETKFEIVLEAQQRFAHAVRGAAEGDIRIDPAAAPPAQRDRAAPGAHPDRTPGPPRGKGPRGAGPPPGGPRPRPKGGKPASRKPNQSPR